MRSAKAGLGISVLCALIVGCGFAPPAVPEPDAAALTAFPNTVVSYYDVPGTNARAIRAYINTHGAADPNDGSMHDAFAHWRLNWRWPGVNGVCDLTKVQVTFSGTVLLPRLTEADRLSPAVRNDWNRYMTALITHESGHLRHAYAHMEDVAQAIRPATCDTANAAGMAAIKALGQYDAEYDRDTRHGATQGATFPGR